MPGCHVNVRVETLSWPNFIVQILEVSVGPIHSDVKMHGNLDKAMQIPVIIYHASQCPMPLNQHTASSISIDPCDLDYILGTNPEGVTHLRVQFVWGNQHSVETTPLVQQHRHASYLRVDCMLHKLMHHDRHGDVSV